MLELFDTALRVVARSLVQNRASARLPDSSQSPPSHLGKLGDEAGDLACVQTIWIRFSGLDKAIHPNQEATRRLALATLPTRQCARVHVQASRSVLLRKPQRCPLPNEF